MILNYRRFRRSYQRRFLLLLLFIFLVDAVHQCSLRPETYRSSTKPPFSLPNSRNHTVFIVSVHRNTEKVQKAAWNEAILNLVDHIGPHNVHFSAVESGSQEKTKDMLLELKEGLDRRGASNTISLGMTVWEQLDELDARPPPDAREPGWIWNKKEDKFEMRRIPYLSRTRNQAMEPLRQLEREGRTFDQVLWVNDVVFDTEDVVTLFNTRDGEYAAACSMDYKLPPHYYDTFALRDDTGLKTISSYWPWFQSPSSREAALTNSPIPVVSCWNGIVAFDAAPFYNNPPLEFRGIEDSLADLHLEGSECCLIHADNYLSPEKGVWLNPNVRVGYNVAAYRKIRRHRFPGVFSTVVGAWANRFSRWRGSLQLILERRVVQSRLEKWAAETPNGQLPRYEPGEACLINEMQIMWSNGWKHL